MQGFATSCRVREDELLQQEGAMIGSLGKLLPSVPATQLQAASKADDCNVCVSNARIPVKKLSSLTSVFIEAVDSYDQPESQSVLRVYEEEDEWEFAENDEKENENEAEASAQNLAGAIAVPNVLQVRLPSHGEAPLLVTGDSDKSNSSLEVRTVVAGGPDGDIGWSSSPDWLEPPPVSGILAMEESCRQVEEGAMLEAFQQFQHNAQVQNLVVALATDEGVWRAVLANKKIQEYRVVNTEGDFEVGTTQDLTSVAAHSRMAASFTLQINKAVCELKEGLQDQVRVIIDAVGKKLQTEARKLMLDVVLRAFTTMTVVMLTLIAILCLLPLEASLE